MAPNKAAARQRVTVVGPVGPVLAGLVLFIPFVWQLYKAFILHDVEGRVKTAMAKASGKTA